MAAKILGLGFLMGKREEEGGIVHEFFWGGLIWVSNLENFFRKKRTRVWEKLGF